MAKSTCAGDRLLLKTKVVIKRSTNAAVKSARFDRAGCELRMEFI